jgi:hypothetical protein
VLIAVADGVELQVAVLVGADDTAPRAALGRLAATIPGAVSR